MCSETSCSKVVRPVSSARTSSPQCNDFQSHFQTSPNIIYHGLRRARNNSPAMYNVRLGAVPPEHSFQGVKKKDHTKVDILSRGFLRVVVSMWSAMASQHGHQWHLKNTSYCRTLHLCCEFRCQHALVREAERAKAGGSEAPGGRVAETT